jgi:hypothetical protein
MYAAIIAAFVCAWSTREAAGYARPIEFSIVCR